MRVLLTLTFCFLAIYLAVFSFLPVETGDVFWHLSVGRWIVENFQVPKIDPFPLVEPARPWLHTQWMGSSIYFLVQSFAGLNGLKILRCLIFLAAMLIFYVYSQRKAPRVFLFVLIYLMSFAFLNRLFLRPLLFNVIFVQFLLIVLFSYLEKPDMKKLYVLPLMALVWTNIHIGSLVYGMMIFGVFWLNSLVNYFQSENTNRTKSLRDISLAMILFFVALFIDPSGFGRLVYQIKLTFFSQVHPGYTFTNLLYEFHSPTYILSLNGAWFWALLFIGVFSLIKSKKYQFLRCILFATAVAFFLHSRRGSVIFALVTGYIVVTGLEDYFKSLKVKEIIRNFLSVVLIAVLCVHSIYYFNRYAFLDNKDRRYSSLETAPYNHFYSLDFLKRKSIKTNVLTLDGAGGQVLWAAYPDVKPMIDSRFVDLDLHQQYMNVLGLPDVYLEQVKNKYDIQAVMLDTSQRPSQYIVWYLMTNDQWYLASLKGADILFVHKELAQRYSVKNQKDVYAQESANVVEAFEYLATWEEKNRAQKFIAMLRKNYQYIEPLEEGVVLFNGGYLEAGLRKMFLAVQFTSDERAYQYLERALEVYRDSLPTD